MRLQRLRGASLAALACVALTACATTGSHGSNGDDAAFCHRVSDMLALGYRLHGGPALTFNGERVIVAQAVLWPEALDSGAA